LSESSLNTSPISAHSQHRQRAFFIDQMPTAVVAGRRALADEPDGLLGVGSTANSFAARFTTPGEAIDVPESFIFVPPHASPTPPEAYPTFCYDHSVYLSGGYGCSYRAISLSH
jgi:hypothetical protein